MKTIVIRGCIFRVTLKQARELEREAFRKEWATNQLP